MYKYPLNLLYHRSDYFKLIPASNSTDFVKNILEKLATHKDLPIKVKTFFS